MSRSLLSIALRWRLAHCAMALLSAFSACSTALSAPGNQLVPPYRGAPMAPRRVAQAMPTEPIAPIEEQPGLMYDGGGPGSMTPTPADGYRGSNYNGGMQGGAYGGQYEGSYGGSCSCGNGCGSGCGGSGGCDYDCYGDSNCGDCGYGACGYGDCGGGCYDAFCGMYCNEPRVSFYVDWLALQVTDADVAHAQQQDGIGGAGTVPFGRIGTVDIDYDNGIRFGGSVGCGPCTGFTWSITNFESDNRDRVHPPFIPNGNGAVGSLVQHPAAQITASAGPVEAAYDIDYRLADMMCRRYLTGGPCYTVNYQLGVQYGHLEQLFAQEGVFSGGQTGTIDTFTSVDFDGAGVKAGLDAERRLGWGFMTYGKLTAAIMTGRFSSRYNMVNTTTDILLARSVWKDDRVVPQLEYELGLGWQSPSGHWRFTTGYMLSHWANVVTTPEFIDAVQADNYVDVDGNLTFDGAVTRVELRW